VQPDEPLAGIANRLNISIAELSYLNGFSPTESLVSGQSILIPHLRKVIVSLAYFQLRNLEDLGRTLTEIGTSITYGALFQLSVSVDAVFIIPKDTGIERYVALLKSYHILPLLVITNLGPERFDPDLARAIIGNTPLKNQTIINLIQVLAHFGFAGVNLDFENINPEDRQLYSDFVHDVKRILGAEGYLVTLTVPPKNSDSPENAFDYQALGQWADLIFIMTYDWGYMTGPPMAVAPINEIQKVLSYAVSTIPRSKIMQGIPLYGYDWQLPFTPGSSAKAVNLVDVYNLARRFGAAIDFDHVAASPNFHYTNEAGNEHVVWFEDSRSVRAKYAGARNFGIGGVGFWSGLNFPYGFHQNWVIFNEMFLALK
jgi:spore germination protein